MFVGTGCGPDDDPPTMLPTKTATRTAAAPTSTATPVPPTPTPTAFPPHVEFVVGSVEEGSGALHAVAEYEGDIPLYLSQCFNGEGDDCEGGTAVYTAGSPGIEGLEEDEPEEPLFVLDEETPITLRLDALTEGLSFMSGADRLAAPGATALLGVAPELHADLSTTLIRAGGDLTPVEAQFTLTTTKKPPYEDSGPFTVRFVPVIGADPGGDDDD